MCVRSYTDVIWFCKVMQISLLDQVGKGYFTNVYAVEDAAIS